MKNRQVYYLFFFVIISFFSSCEKEFSSENNMGTSSASGTSSYSFVDANTNCSFAIVNSSYVVNIPTTGANTVQLQVKVTALGTYSISTPTINGIYFIASGTFTALGIQPITFVAKGTPVVRGKFPYSPGSNGCSFPITIKDTGAINNPLPPPNSTNPTPVTDGVFTCKVDGLLTTFNYNARATITTQGFSAFNAGGYQIAANGSNVPEFQFYITKNDNSAISAGTYNEKSFLSPTGYNIEVDYQVVNPDRSVTIFNTSSNILPPDNPPFTIIITSISATRVKGTFNGSLTNTLEGSTKTKIIIDGIFDEPVQ